VPTNSEAMTGVCGSSKSTFRSFAQKEWMSPPITTGLASRVSRIWVRSRVRAAGNPFRSSLQCANSPLSSRFIAGSDAERERVAGKRPRPPDARRRDGRGQACQERATREGTTSSHRASLTIGYDSSRCLLRPTVSGQARKRTGGKAAMTATTACCGRAWLGIKPRDKRAPSSPPFSDWPLTIH
jgi:hypothetical protein